MKQTTVVQSSWAVHKISYNDRTRVLTIEMENAPPKSHGEILRYANVPKEVHEEFISASSKGYFFNKVIRPHFPKL